MSHHLHNGTLNGELRPGEHTHQNKAHVADTGVGYETFEIGLSKRKQCTIENPGSAQGHRQH